MHSQPHILDLEFLISNVDQIRQHLVEVVQTHGATFTDLEEQRWEGAFTAVRGILADELQPCLDAWRKGHPFSRAAEKLLGQEVPPVSNDLIARMTTFCKTVPYLADKPGFGLGWDPSLAFAGEPDERGRFPLPSWAQGSSAAGEAVRFARHVWNANNPAPDENHGDVDEVNSAAVQDMLYLVEQAYFGE